MIRFLTGRTGSCSRGPGLAKVIADIAQAADAAKGKNEQDAVVAYLQGLGTVLKNVR